MGTSNIPVGVQAGSPPVFGAFRGDARYRAQAPASVVLTGALQSLGLAVPFPQIIALGQNGGLVLEYDLFFSGASGAVSGFNLSMSGDGSSGVYSVHGPGGAIITPRIDAMITNAVSPAYATFDISALAIGVAIKVKAMLLGVPNNIPNFFDLRAQNSGAGIYTFVLGLVTAYQL